MFSRILLSNNNSRRTAGLERFKVLTTIVIRAVANLDSGVLLFALLIGFSPNNPSNDVNFGQNLIIVFGHSREALFEFVFSDTQGFASTPHWSAHRSCCVEMKMLHWRQWCVHASSCSEPSPCEDFGTIQERHLKFTLFDHRWHPVRNYVMKWAWRFQQTVYEMGSRLEFCDD